jgi:hypothetical protein
VVPAPATGVVVLQHPFVDGIFYKGTGVQQVRVSAVVRLQAAARGLLARRRLREMQQIEQPTIAVMEMTRTCPRAAVVRLPVAVRGLLARRHLREVRHHPKPIGGLQIFSGHNNAREAHSQLLPRDPDRSMLAGVLRVYMQLIPGLLLWDPGGSTHADRRASGAHRSAVTEIKKSRSIFQIKNIQISRDVKGLFSGHRFAWSRVIVKVPMLQLEDELLGKGRANVRCQGTNGPGPMGRLNRPIRVRFRDKIKSLLRGQVILSI